jgi:hypothetical protein
MNYSPSCTVLAHFKTLALGLWAFPGEPVGVVPVRAANTPELGAS